ncbi:hypothetical protein D9619_012853 [Psilocybe cf. subviscida]|uniref:Uncharacterized protein n=1 Tax=Psilocybe cf. subviscida TaxID=2480587 RepID=A0A8H5F594_9AGAR|nr:hypothetical protein D9619_012853 [Psilocybe cf. subviscida]
MLATQKPQEAYQAPSPTSPTSPYHEQTSSHSPSPSRSRSATRGRNTLGDKITALGAKLSRTLGHASVGEDLNDPSTAVATPDDSSSIYSNGEPKYTGRYTGRGSLSLTRQRTAESDVSGATAVVAGNGEHQSFLGVSAFRLFRLGGCFWALRSLSSIFWTSVGRGAHVGGQAGANGSDGGGWREKLRRCQKDGGEMFISSHATGSDKQEEIRTWSPFPPYLWLLLFLMRLPFLEVCWVKIDGACRPGSELFPACPAVNLALQAPTLSPLFFSFTLFTDRSVSRGREAYSTGRGGAGNIRQQSFKSPSPASPTGNPNARTGLGPDDFSVTRGREPAAFGRARGVSPGSNGVYSTGRGGAGNLRSPSREAGRAALNAGVAQDEQVIRDYVEKQIHDGVSYSTGRGGAGNITSRDRSKSQPRDAPLTTARAPHAAYNSQPQIFSTGRGGAGNIVQGDVAAAELLDGEERRRVALSGSNAAPSQVHSTGRGGGGNITAQPVPPVEHAYGFGAEQDRGRAGRGAFESHGRGGAGNIAVRGQTPAQTSRSRSRARD